MSAHTVYWLDGTPVDDRCASEGIQFAYGLFETMRFDHGALEQPGPHLERMNAGFARLGLGFSLSEEALRLGFEAAKAASGMASGALKVLAMRRGAPVEKADVDVQLYLRPNPYRDEADGGLAKPCSLGISAYSKNSRSVVAGLKWQGYADHIIEKDRAMSRGFNDVLFLNEMDFVAETAVANVFWFSGGKLFTPSLDCGILPGVMRQNVLKAAADAGISVSEGRFPLERLLEAELVFVTNSLMRLKVVDRLEQVVWPRPLANAPALRYFESLRAAVKAGCQGQTVRDWAAPGFDV
ncbi:aminotransferase class IV [Acidaminobacter hydrogenoformans]|uniref:4-amino-4-deoxychorismate lyase n=1 Tax=Acidaminobacter hydrogenoformans DSM 2784 TaxID=1120920 RepID=A0A1G5RVC9_9FIRM|nr:aminotransferase class IV [Acidaminobacter hydrogenoformans]SCZ77680.1 4-amino-4-deoxychorismate lyase [Acidaminobacter hydrogenoformans DSM 2784]